MRIAEVADIVVPVPPSHYGGTENVVSAVTEGLVAGGHEVTLFANQYSHTRGSLVATENPSPGFHHWNNNPLVEAVRMHHIQGVIDRADSFDIIHNHLLQLFGVIDHLRTPILTTVHSNPADPIVQQLFALPEVNDTYFVSPSNSQRKLMPELNFVDTIYHGIDVQSFPFNAQGGDYLLFLGRLAKQKGPEIAVEVAKRTGKKLIIAAKYNKPASPYVKGLLKLFEETPNVEFIGEVSGDEKKTLLNHAYAFLMPIQWEEPFGLVVVEAMATGTPVIAFKRGSMPEIIEDGISGFLVSDTQEMVKAVSSIEKISRAACRDRVARYFTIDRMVAGYEKAFESAQRIHLLKQRVYENSRSR